jgi:diguanylate cyclase (GGDEF)-like protein/PAS domain S-box-containing protein
MRGYATYFGLVFHEVTHYVALPRDGLYQSVFDRNALAVILPDRIRVLLRRRPVWLAGCTLLVAALLILYVISRRDWQQRTAELQRENMALQLRQLASGITQEYGALAADARELAESDATIEFVQEGAGPAAPHFDAGAVDQLDGSSLLVVTTGQVLIFSGAAVNHRLVERPPDVAVLQYLDSIIAARASLSPAAANEPAVGFANDQFTVVQPIVPKSSSMPLGWLVATRSISQAMLARLQGSFSGPLAGYPVRQLDPDAMPRDIRTWVASRTGHALGVATRVSGSQLGYAVLRDESGRAVWVFRLARGPAGAPTAAGAGAADLEPQDAGLTVGLAAFVALLVAAVAAIVIIALKRYFGHRRSVDSRYKAIIDQTNDGIVIVDSGSLQIQYCNPAFLARIGYTNAEAEMLTLTDIFADADASPESVLARLKNADSQLALNMQLRCKNETYVDIEVRCNQLDVDGRDGLAYVTHDVSVRRKAEQQLIDNQQRLDKMAHHDQLTSLPNRHYLAGFLPEAIAEAQAAGSMLGVVFLDLDRFKHINDTRGHETGDKLLQEVARRLRACVRDSDVVIRMGGDEFVVVFRNVKSYDEVTLGANRIIETLDKPIIIDQHPLQTTGSVGVSLFPRDGNSMGELLKHSDTAMYQAKDRGRNNVQMFSQIMNRKLKHRVSMEASLREALRLKQLDVHYQPFVNLLTRKVVGLEALMRWRHPVHGMIPADQFIPVAEETGLIVPMGNFVLHRTLQTLSAWQKTGMTLVPISLNVAPAQLQRGELQSTISTLLKTHGLRPEILQLEMTERAVFDSNQAKSGENRQDTIARLRDLGIKIAIDDFGTGYSSLSYLKNWRVDALKIDRSFVRDLVTDSSDLAIVSAIIAIARHLHIQVIAEGIEGYQQAEILRKLGCTIGQGYLFARPMPADQCFAMLRSEAQGAAEEEDMLAVFASGRA